jgi:hypothetical protein
MVLYALLDWIVWDMKGIYVHTHSRTACLHLSAAAQSGAGILPTARSYVYILSAATFGRSTFFMFTSSMFTYLATLQPAQHVPTSDPFHVSHLYAGYEYGYRNDNGNVREILDVWRARDGNEVHLKSGDTTGLLLKPLR